MTIQSKTLLHLAQEQGCHLVLLEDEGELARIAAIIGEGERLRFLQPQIRGEVMPEIRWTDRETKASGDGIDLATFGADRHP